MSTTTTPSLALQSLLLGATTRCGLSRPASRITGLGGSARALAVAAAAHRVRPAPVVFVLPTDVVLDDAVDDVRFMLRSLEGLADTAVERLVLPFPSLQEDPYRGLAPHFRATSARAHGRRWAALPPSHRGSRSQAHVSGRPAISAFAPGEHDRLRRDNPVHLSHPHREIRRTGRTRVAHCLSGPPELNGRIPDRGADVHQMLARQDTVLFWPARGGEPAHRR